MVEPVMCRVRATCDMRLGPVFSKGADHTSDDRSGSEKEIPIRRVANFKDDYAEDDLKLRGSTAYDVLIPKGIDLSLTPAEKKMIEMKESAERQAMEASEESGQTSEKMSDAEILKAEMAALLKRMRDPDLTTN